MIVRFNGYELTEKFALLDDLSRPLPEFRHESVDVPGMDGTDFDAQTVGPRSCSFSLAALGESEEHTQTLWRELAAALAVRTPSPLTFSDERDEFGTQLVRYAVPSGVPDLDEWRRAGRALLTFEQDDPYLYGRSRSVMLESMADTRIEVGGNVPAHPRLVTKVDQFSEGVPFSLLDAAGNVIKTVAAWYSAGTARTVVIDEEKLSVTITPSGSSDTGITLGSRFFQLSGTCYVRAGGSPTLNWRERWI